MSDEALQALLQGVEESPTSDLTGVPGVSEDEVLDQLQPEKAAEPDEEEEKEEEQAPEPEKVAEPESFLDTLAAVDFSPEEAYQLKVPMQNPDGEVVYKTVGELKDEYKQAVELNRLKEQTENELAARKSELESGEARFRMTQAEMLQMPQELYEVNARIVATEKYIQENQDKLAAENPGGLALSKQELQSLQYQRDNLQQQILNQRESVQNSLKQEQMVQQHQTLQKAEEEMLKLIPEWTDGEVRKAESLQLLDYGEKQGFSSDQLKTIMEPRVVKYLRDQMIKDAKLAAVKPRDDARAPLRPQAVKRKSSVDKAAYNKLIKDAKNSNDPRRKVDGIVALLQNS